MKQFILRISEGTSISSYIERVIYRYCKRVECQLIHIEAALGGRKDKTFDLFHKAKKVAEAHSVLEENDLFNLLESLLIEEIKLVFLADEYRFELEIDDFAYMIVRTDSDVFSKWLESNSFMPEE